MAWHVGFLLSRFSNDTRLCLECRSFSDSLGGSLGADKMFAQPLILLCELLLASRIIVYTTVQSIIHCARPDFIARSSNKFST